MGIDEALLTLGGLLAAGLAADWLGRQVRIPRVTILILIGVAAGPSGLNLLPEAFHSWYDFLATAALTMVAFLLGGTLTRSRLAARGRDIAFVSIAVVLVTIAAVAGGLLLLGVDPAAALLLAGIATATDPAAIQDVVRQSGAKGRFADTLLGIVAIDDTWGLIAFSLLLIAAKSIAGAGGGDVLLEGLWELGGAFAVGLGIGVPAAYLTGRLKPGEPMLVEALSVVFLCAGLAIWLGVSFLLAGMVAGAAVANIAPHHDYAFHEIELVEWPFMLLFFVLAGVSLDTGTLAGIGLAGLGYVVLRAAGRIAGGWAGAALAGVPRTERRWIGAALMPQAGVAVGMALVAAEQFPGLRDLIVPVTIATTIVFELAGPIVALVALERISSAASERE